ncbi:zinc finger domain-containing protein [Mycobacteroides abscessus]
MSDYQDIGSRQKPTAYTETGADRIVCPECGVPEHKPCRWIPADKVGEVGKPRHLPHESRWRR